MSRIRIQENVQYLSSNFFGFLLAPYPRNWDAIKQFWEHQVNQKGQFSIILHFYGNSEELTFSDRRLKSTHSEPNSKIDPFRRGSLLGVPPLIDNWPQLLERPNHRRTVGDWKKGARKPPARNQLFETLIDTNWPSNRRLRPPCQRST